MTIFGLLTPFRRDARSDFAAGSGRELVLSKAEQVLLTEGDTPVSSGELPWRTAFGAGLTRLRHQKNSAALAEVARVYVREALRRWLSSASVRQLTAESREARLTLRLGLSTGSGPVETTVEVER